MQIDNETQTKGDKPSKMEQLHISDGKTLSPGEELSSEPDILISSSDWPSSPTVPYQTRQLPPDSDQDEPMHSEQESLPATSHPLDCTTSSRPSLIKQSSTPFRKSSQLPRSSISAERQGSSQRTHSSSTMEEKSFICPDSTCSKRYRGSSGLKYHVDVSYSA